MNRFTSTAALLVAITWPAFAIAQNPVETSLPRFLERLAGETTLNNSNLVANAQVYRTRGRFSFRNSRGRTTQVYFGGSVHEIDSYRTEAGGVYHTRPTDPEMNNLRQAVLNRPCRTLLLEFGDLHTEDNIENHLLQFQRPIPSLGLSRPEILSQRLHEFYNYTSTELAQIAREFRSTGGRTINFDADGSLGATLYYYRARGRQTAFRLIQGASLGWLPLVRRHDQPYLPLSREDEVGIVHFLFSRIPELQALGLESYLEWLHQDTSQQGPHVTSDDDFREEYMTHVLQNAPSPVCVVANTFHIYNILRRLDGRIIRFNLDAIELGRDHREDFVGRENPLAPTRDAADPGLHSETEAVRPAR